MLGIAVRNLSLVALAACTIVVPMRVAAATPKPVFIVDVAALGVSVVATITTNNKSITMDVKDGETEEFGFPVGVTHYTFDIIGCGKKQSKTLYVSAGHPGAKITVYAGCVIVIAGR